MKPDNPPEKFFAHTAEDEQGNRLSEASGKWQPLATHLRNVAKLAKQFAKPLGLAEEAELTGLLHDLGKYARRFQARLRDNSFTVSTIGLRERLVLLNYASTTVLLQWTAIIPEFQQGIGCNR